MSDQLPQVSDNDTDLAQATDRVQRYVEQSMSENTRRAYKADWRCFTDYCQARGAEALPALSETVAAYISELADGSWGQTDGGYAASTIERRLTTIRTLHRAKGHDDPTQSETVARTWQGIRRDDDVQVNQDGRGALLTEDIRAMVDHLDTDTTKGKRDRAILLLGYATGMRRSEIANLDVDDLDFRARGVVVHIASSKTDQQGEGRSPYATHGGEYCPVQALKTWIEAADIDEGPVFRSVGRWGNARDSRLSGKSINRIVKGAAEYVEHLDASELGAHSLRAGHVTQRKIEGESNDAIMDQTGHTSESTMRRYDRRAKQFRHDVSGSLGL
jgi:site-specific recombinase XerD